MKKNSTIPKALAFLGLIAVCVACYFVIRNANEKKEEEDRLQEIQEVGALPNMSININGKIYTAKTEVSRASQKLLEEFPLEVQMERKGRFISGYTYFKLPTEPRKIKNIKKGDIIIIDDSHIGIAIDSFETSQRYTLIGHIDNLKDVPKDNIIVGFNKK